MRVERYLDKIIVYIYFSENSLCIKEIIKKVIKDLNKYYDIKIKGSYVLKLYLNSYYGMILEIKENYKSNNNLVKINLKILKNSLILYEVDDPLDYMEHSIYYFDNKFYVSLKKNDINIMENSNIIYSKDAYKVIGGGIKIN